MGGDQLTIDDELPAEPDDDEDETWEQWWAKLPKTPPGADQVEREAA